MMKVAVIGTGYVGLPTGVGLAELGNRVVCVDKLADKINKLNRGELTLYEDGLEELFKKNVAAGALSFLHFQIVPGNKLLMQYNVFRLF